MKIGDNVSVATTLSGNFERKWEKCCQIELLERCILPNNVAVIRSYLSFIFILLYLGTKEEYLL